MTTLSRLRVTNAGAALYPPGATFGPRRMKDHEFVWIIAGSAVAHFDRQRIDAPAGTVLLCRPGMVDRYEWARKRQTLHAYFHFDFYLPSRGWPPAEKWPLARTMPPGDILRPLFRYVLGLHPLLEPARSALLRPCVELMLRSFVSGRLTTAAEPHAQLPPPVERALALLQEVMLQEPSPTVTLSQLARAAHVTPEHLCRLFRKTLNRGPLECARLIRLERAATLLARSNLAVKQVADSTGFASPYHFSRTFRKLYRLPPRAYQQAVRRGATPPAPAVPRVIPVSIFSGSR